MPKLDLVVPREIPRVRRRAGAGRCCSWAGILFWMRRAGPLRLRGGGPRKSKAILQPAIRLVPKSTLLRDESAPRGSSKARSSLQRPRDHNLGAAFNLGRQGFQEKNSHVTLLSPRRGARAARARRRRLHADGVLLRLHGQSDGVAHVHGRPDDDRSPDAHRDVRPWAWGSAAGTGARVPVYRAVLAARASTRNYRSAGPSALRWLRL